ncbi:MAG: exopolysaccharide biosynthesis protein [Pseudomonadota bacterium]
MRDTAIDPLGSVTGIVDRLDRLSSAETLTVRDLVEGFGDTAFVALMAVPALIVVSPLSGIPVLSSICGLTIALIAVQLLLQRKHLWLPSALMARQIDVRRVRRVLGRMRRVAAWLDRRAHRRLSLLTYGPLAALPRALCVVAGLSMPFLELLPFSSSLLGTAVLFFSAGFLTRDGLYTLIGMGFVGIAATIPLTAFKVVTGAA